ncbi:MAG: DUF4865 family protein [Lacisediminihabitans sp.]
MEEPGIHSSSVDQYAPFYGSDDTDGMGAFLWGNNGFGGTVKGFGRPAVQTWAGVSFRRGVAASASLATKETIPIADGVDPATVVPVLQDAHAERAATADVYAALLAVDPRTWQAVLFTLWDAEPGVDLAGTRYAVLHVSQPGGERRRFY